MFHGGEPFLLLHWESNEEKPRSSGLQIIIYFCKIDCWKVSATGIKIFQKCFSQSHCRFCDWLNYSQKIGISGRLSCTSQKFQPLELQGFLDSVFFSRQARLVCIIPSQTRYDDCKNHKRIIMHGAFADCSKEIQWQRQSFAELHLVTCLGYKAE